MNFFKTNKSSLLLLGGLIIGGLIGVLWGEGATMLQPIGQIFVNFMYMVLVPLVFFSISLFSYEKIIQQISSLWNMDCKLWTCSWRFYSRNVLSHTRCLSLRL